MDILLQRSDDTDFLRKDFGIEYHRLLSLASLICDVNPNHIEILLGRLFKIATKKQGFGARNTSSKPLFLCKFCPTWFGFNSVQVLITPIYLEIGF